MTRQHLKLGTKVLATFGAIPSKGVIIEGGPEVYAVKITRRGQYLAKGTVLEFAWWDVVAS